MLLAIGITVACVAVLAALHLGLWLGRHGEELSGDEELADLAVEMWEKAALLSEPSSDGGITALQQSYGWEGAAERVSLQIDRRRCARQGQD